MEIIEDGDRRFVNVISGNRILSNNSYTSYNLGDYFIRRILPTFDGDTRPDFVKGVQEHSLSQLKIVAETSISNHRNELL
jgi:hypothetical protein